MVDLIDRVLAGVGRAAGVRLFEITHEIWRLLTRDIPELRGDDTVGGMGISFTGGSGTGATIGTPGSIGFPG